MLTRNQKGRFDKQLKQAGYTSKQRKNILRQLSVDLSLNMIAANEITLGYFDVSENGKSAIPSNDCDDLGALFCFVSKPFDNGWQYIGYPRFLERGFRQ
jgi:hypothetical protein